MPEAVIGALRVTLGLNSAAFEKGVDKSRAASSSFSRAVSSDFSRLARNIEGQAKILRVSLAGLAGSLAINAVKTGISVGLEYASSLGEVAQQLGVSTRALQEYRYVATQVGIEQDQLDAGLQKLTRSIGQAANGAKVQSAAFDTLGISIRDQNGQLKSTDQILPELIAAFSRIADPARRAAIETQLFGKAGQQLDTLLAGGVSQVNNLRDAANKLGIVLSNEQIQSADDTADKLASLQRVMTANISAVVADNSDAILGLADSFAKLTANVLGSLTAFNDYRNLRALAFGNDIDAGRRLLKSKSGRSALAGYYDQRLSENTAARAQFGVSGAEAKRLDGEIAKVKKLRDLTIAYDARKSKAEAASNRAGAGGAIGGGGGGGGVKVARAARALRAPSARSGPDLRDQATSIIDGLFPQEAEQRRLEQMAETLGKAMAEKIISVPEYEKARSALKLQIASAISPAASVIEAIFPERATIREIEAKMSQLDKDLAARLITDEEWNKANGRLATQLTAVETQLAGVAVIANDNARLVKRSNDEIIQSYADMAQGVLGSIRGLSDSIKGGDFLDVFAGALDVVSQLAGAFGGAGGLFKGSGKPKGADGVSGLNLGGLLSNIPARAKGGPVRAGTAYLVGERGPELFRSKVGGSIIPNHALGRGGISFDLRGAVVTTELYADMQRIANETSGRVVRATAPSIAAAGANGAMARFAREQERTLA